MSVFSRFDPYDATYDYFEADPPLAAMNDDIGTPQMPPEVNSKFASEIGVPSTECGRAMPAGSRHIGRGELAEGHITPPSNVRLSGVGEDRPWSVEFFSFVSGAAVIGCVWVIWEWRK